MSRSLLLALAFCLQLLLPAAWADPVHVDQAFRLQGFSATADGVDVRFEIRDKYYLYGHRFGFRLNDGSSATLGEAQRPPGTPYHDEYFGDVEIYRGTVDIHVPVQGAQSGDTLALDVDFQGCWDGGICYPPETRTLNIALATQAPPPNADANLLDRALARSDAPPADAGITTSSAPASAVSGDEGSRIANVLGSSSVPLALLTFFGFGLLLAFTPCTFPMIPILSGIIAGKGDSISRGRAAGLSMLYVLGMAVTYALAGVAAGLSGTLLTAALQNVWVLSAFALVFVALALAMLGFYELQLPAALQSRIATTANRQRGGEAGGVIMMGALSALIVGPCMAAPLAGALLYIAQTGNAVFGGLTLFVMALGMGVPLILVGIATRSALPKAGPWMDGVKRGFGVLLLAMAIWIVTPVAPALFIMLAWAALLIVSAVFLHALDPLPRRAHGWQRFWKGIGVALLLAGAAIFIGALAGSRDPLQPLAVLRGGDASAQVQAPQFEMINSSAELDALLASSTQTVMLDFYADWCVSCKEMERFTFTDAGVAARMGQMRLVKADVTANTEEHRALLKRFELFGPPGTVFFDGDGKLIEDLRVVGFMRAEPFSALLDRALAQ